MLGLSVDSKRSPPAINAQLTIGRLPSCLPTTHSEKGTGAVLVLVTGGAGFIGNALVRRLLQQSHSVVVLDRLTYAAAPEALDEMAGSDRYAFVHGDVCDPRAVSRVFAEYQPDAVAHLAAESHVDRSIANPHDFVQTNVAGTARMLEASQVFFQALPPAQRHRFRFLQVSTDEVFGSLGPDAPPFTEASPYAPRSPYAASKAAADHLARAWSHTYGLPVVLSHGCNTYGPWQYTEKLIPLMLARAWAGEPMPLYGDGEQVRDWLHVDDHAAALVALLLQGTPGKSYLVGGRSERTNRTVVQAICRRLDQCRPINAPHGRFIVSVNDRPGHDRRYALDPSQIERQIGWKPTWRFEQGLAATVDWYLSHADWWRKKIDKRAHARNLAAE